MRSIAALFCLLAGVAPLAAGAPQKIVVSERWETAYLGGVRSGHVHTIAVEENDNGQIRYVTTVEMRLRLKRLSETIQLGMDSGTIETPAGVVSGIFAKQYVGEKLNLEIKGHVEGNKLQLTLNKKEPLDPVPWNDKVVGLYGQQRVFKEREIKSGDRFGFRSFEPLINLVILTRVHVLDPEEVELHGGAEKRKLLRVEIRGDKVQNYQPPLLVSWLDDRHEPLRSETEIPGFGKIVLYRATREQALAPTNQAGNMAELNQYIPLRQRILRHDEVTMARFRIRIKGDDDAATTFERDQRQSVVSAQGNELELQVRKGPSADAAAAGPEYLASCHFINSADAKVREHGRRAVGAETDPWRKAVRIERWVHDRMTPKAHQSLASADDVARNLEGDCTEYAMLMAAMCRAEGVPARTAIGLVYAEVRGGPVFAFHMWTEVWIRGKWLPLDATLGRGGIGAMHLKISDQSWRDERTMAPLLPVLRVLGRVSIDVLHAEITPEAP